MLVVYLKGVMFIKHKRKSKFNFKVISILVIIILVFVLRIGMYKNNQLINLKDNQQMNEDNVIQQKVDKYKDKIWYAIGDSITAQNMYPYYLKDMIHLKSYINDGIYGQEMGTMADRITTRKLANIALVTVFGGTNDYALGKKLGTINDDETINSFYGNVQKVIGKIQTANPKTEIVFMTPIKRGKFENLQYILIRTTEV
ncbi:MAG TPA: SGNH/GDSL hydrolase family protein [Clostridium sp.]